MRKILLFLFLIPSVISGEPVKSLLGARGTDMPTDEGIVSIEYLKSTGTQYILLPVHVSKFTSSAPVISIKYRFSPKLQTFLFGCGSGSRWYIACYPSTLTFTCQFGNKGRFTRSDRLGDIHSLTIMPSLGIVEEDGVEYSFTSNDLNSDSNYICIFGFYDTANATISRLATAEIYSFRVYDSIGEELILDLIPVRIGSTGYMLDVLSGELYGNMGRGEFIIGPDKE